MNKEKFDRTFPAIRLAENAREEAPSDLHQRKLEQLAKRLDQFHDFHKGHFVKWKPGLKNRHYPDYGEPAIVMAVLPNPIYDLTEANAHSPYFQEPLTFVIGIYREDDLLEFRMDSRRFEPFDHN